MTMDEKKQDANKSSAPRGLIVVGIGVIIFLIIGLILMIKLALSM